MNQRSFYHITQPESVLKRDYQPCLCGSNDGKRVAFMFLRGFLASNMVKPENLCQKCYDLYQAKKDQTPW
jgi:hypothetical protein